MRGAALALIVGAAAGLGVPALSQTGFGQQCVRNSECDAPLICRYGRCKVECTTNRDCGDGRFCVATGAAAGLPQCTDRGAIVVSWFPKLLADTVIWGGDIADVPLARAAPLDCHSECLANPDCVGWSYAPPGVAGRNVPWCYLKGPGGQAQSRAGSVSAMVVR
ncbi:MAG: PAN domain-containing protein [Rhodobacteraceae bacterium]|nr:PAN domain-containing protein [Paracoccaceae bacterium]